MHGLVLAGLMALSLAAPVAAQDYVPAHERDGAQNIGSGPEMVLVYFGASWCAPCHTAGLKSDLGRAKVLLAERAAEEGKAFAVMGVALDYDLEAGLGLLRESGGFDEVAVGRNWFNAASLAHLWRPEGAGERGMGLPAVVVFEREMTMAETISASAPTYRAEAVGVYDIAAWVEAGAPLDGEERP